MMLVKRIGAVALGAALVACGAGAPPDDEAEDLRLYVLDCGRIGMTSEAVEMFGLSPDETDVRELADPCYVVEHPRGRLLWDSGLPSSLAEAEGWQEEENGSRMRLDRTLAAQLAELSLDMGSFDYVAFSHMHFDHVGAANELTGGTLIIQQAEHDAAFGDDVAAAGFDPATYEGLRGMDMEVIDGDHDVFGDGRVRIISAPGHTPGHQALLVQLAETGPVLLGGDLYHFRISREQQRVPVFNVDAEQTRESMRRVEALAEEAGAELWIQHELALFEGQRKAPEFYR